NRRTPRESRKRRGESERFVSEQAGALAEVVGPVSGSGGYPCSPLRFHSFQNLVPRLLGGLPVRIDDDLRQGVVGRVLDEVLREIEAIIARPAVSRPGARAGHQVP